MTVRLFISKDSSARSVGADAVALAVGKTSLALGQEVEIVRTGSYGMLWLEPLVEVQTAQGRVAYGPVQPEDVSGLFASGWLQGAEHPLRLGEVGRLEWMRRQDRLLFARCGLEDPLSLETYCAGGGLVGLERALRLDPTEILEEILVSGLRGRGGAGFPTGIKWRTVAQADADRKYIVCNADEGDSGTFADRMLMEGDPFTLIEGMIIAGLAVGAEHGFIYVRSEYPDAERAMKVAIAVSERAGLLGASVLGSRHAFYLQIRRGAGAYICGEETSLLESLEGKRGIVRVKPPLPALRGLFGRPTVVNNVLSLASVVWILTHGGAAYAAYGIGRSRGTMPVQLAGNIKRGGLLEIAFGVSLGELIEEWGGGTRSGRPVRAVQVGGPLGAYLPASQLETVLDYESMAAIGAMVGHAGIVVFDDQVNMARQARFSFKFCADESCGKCTPCRVGAVRGIEVMDRIMAGEEVERNLALLDDLAEVMRDGSLCAMGGLTPMPVMSARRHFAEDFTSSGR